MQLLLSIIKRDVPVTKNEHFMNNSLQHCFSQLSLLITAAATTQLSHNFSAGTIVTGQYLKFP